MGMRKTAAAPPWREKAKEKDKYEGARLRATKEPGQTPTMYVPPPPSSRQARSHYKRDSPFDIDSELRYTFQRNFQFLRKVFSIDTIVKPLPAPLGQSVGRNLGFFTRIFTQFFGHGKRDWLARGSRVDNPPCINMIEHDDGGRLRMLWDIRRKQQRVGNTSRARYETMLEHHFRTGEDVLAAMETDLEFKPLSLATTNTISHALKRQFLLQRTMVRRILRQRKSVVNATRKMKSAKGGRKRRYGKEPAQRPIPNREQLRATMAAKYYKEVIPQDIKKEIETAEKELWSEHAIFQEIDEFEVLADWVQDPSNTRERLTLYDRLIATLWTNKCLLAQVLMDRNKEVSTLKTKLALLREHRLESAALKIELSMLREQRVENRLMHKKLNIIAKRLGIEFIPRAPLARQTPDTPLIIADEAGPSGT